MGRASCTATWAAGPPAVDLEAERLLGEILIAGSRDGMISAAHDLSEGGLAQTLVEMCLAGETGARIVLPEDADPFVWLFSESTARVVVAVPRTEELRFTEMCTVRRQPWVKIGVVDRGDTGAPEEQLLDIQDVATVSLSELREAWEGTLPASLRLTDVIRYSVGPRRRPDRRPVHRPGPGRPAAARVERRRPAVARAIPD